MVTRDNITDELLAGTTPAQLARKYPRKSVYRIYNELKESGQIPEPGTIVIDEGGGEPQPFIPAASTYTPPTPSVALEEKKREAGAETVEIGPKTLPADAVNRIRGILGITLRPKVLSCPMPELLYPAMVIAVTELGFKPMKPDDFIDTVLYQWLESCDYVPYAYMKRSELEDYAKRYGLHVEEYAKEHGLMTVEEFAKKYNITLPSEGENVVAESLGEEAVVEPVVEELKEEIAEMQKEAEDEAKETGTEPHKPTVGDLLKRLHIDNIRKEVENGTTRDRGNRQVDGEAPGES